MDPRLNPNSAAYSISSQVPDSDSVSKEKPKAQQTRSAWGFKMFVCCRGDRFRTPMSLKSTNGAEQAMGSTKSRSVGKARISPKSRGN